MKNITSTLLLAALTLSPSILTAEPTATYSEKKTEKKKADQEITIEANDQMQFNKKELEVKAGETVKLTLTHVGKLPKAAMGHNLVILKKDTYLVSGPQKAMPAAATDYIPADEESKKAVVAHTKVIGGGESDTITFSIAEAGEYEYLCSFPGHFAIMKGKITVK